MGEFMAKLSQIAFFSREMRSHWLLIFCIILASATAGLSWPRVASAAPDPGVISGTTATFKGDQHLGIQGKNSSSTSPPNDFSTQSIATLYVNSLTKDIMSSSPYLAGIWMSYAGASGTNGGERQPGNPGETGKQLSIEYDGGGFTLQNGSYGGGNIHLENAGGTGGNGGDAPYQTAKDETGGKGGDGGDCGNLSVTSHSGSIVYQGEDGVGIVVMSTGGKAGHGGDATTGAVNKATGGAGGIGGDGGDITVDNNSPITLSSGSGINVYSTGGGGNYGNEAGGEVAYGGAGGNGGAGGDLMVTNRGSITVTGSSYDQQHGIYAVSQGGDALNRTGADHEKKDTSGGFGGGSGGHGGAGGKGGSGGAVTIKNYGIINVQNSTSDGIYALSKGGKGGTGGEGDGLKGVGGPGGGGGAGGTVSVTNNDGADITTAGNDSNGILAVSLGGSGGDGGEGNGVAADPGAAEMSGKGGLVTVGNSGAILTKMDSSRGIFAQSVGGFAGSGGDIGFAIGGYAADGGSGGDGGGVTVTNTGGVTTKGKDSEALFAQSVGGGGGAGGSDVGIFTMGGDGNAGGKGGMVTVTNSGKLETAKDDADGIFAQSVGGGGGNGGATGSISIGLSVSMGGNGGTGGDGGNLSVTSSNAVDTSGKNASGIFAQSAGGGGGNGGYAVSAAAGPSFTTSISLGGSGSSGGAGGTVNVNSQSAIHTQGENAYGIFAESLGGGGGNGGFSVSTTASVAASHNISLGGKGGDGGGADSTHTQKVTVTNNGNITTGGVNASGILAQSIGGGGGAGGFSATGSLTSTRNTSFSLGGSSGGGGSGGEVNVTNNNAIVTSGKMATGVLAQSVGGGGGNGGFSLNLSAAPIQGGMSLGGSGDKDKSGGSGGYVKVNNNAGITTGSAGMACGDSAACEDPDADPNLCSCGLSYGILAQSIGGGGGAGGYSFTGGIGIGAFDFSLGGTGGKGGYGGLVDVYNYGVLETYANGSHGILAQSVGGGGGAGGAATSVAMTFAFSVEDIPIPSAGFTLAIGGKGGGGGGADSTHTQKVTVNNYNNILTNAEGSTGILAQSIGGGGGDGGWAAAGSGSISEGETVSVNVAVALGGTGGTGGKGGEVQVINSGTTQTKAKNSPGILAQSIGGGGGNGGLSAAATMSYSSKESATFNSAVSIGGSGANAGPGSKVTVTSSAPVNTMGDESTGIEAQSIGGGGGNGGASITGSLSLGKSPDTAQLQESIGGKAGGGGNADSVTVSLTGNGNVTTKGKEAMGILAQSIGGGGGEGGMSFNGQFANNKSKNMSFSVGGLGGKGGNGSGVTVSSSDNTSVSTSGSDSHGIMAQSIGGGGGEGGLSGNGSFSIRKGEGDSIAFKLAVGGTGGAAGNGGAVTMRDAYADISTLGDNSCGIFAQSIGGGGGEGGGAFTANIAWSPDDKSDHTPDGEDEVEFELGVTVGGKGGGGGAGGTVALNNYGNINTSGDKAHGVFAQSIGGGGGAGGEAKDFALVITDPSFAPEALTGMTITVGGDGGSGNYGSTVNINNFGAITTYGDYAKGILAQSIGGGGGEGGSTGGKIRRTTVLPDVLSISVGGTGGGSSIGGEVDVTNNGTVTTFGEGAYGIQAQSIGGGGGNGGEGEMGLLTLSLALGGYAGSGSHGGLVNVINSGAIDTSGDGAHGIFAQSVGGGGGVAGNVARFALIETEETEVSIGIGIGWAPAKGGHGGDGGKVVVANNSDITTRGASAYGILAQSVGGGGGAGGEVGYGPGAYFNYLMGSVGGDGYGGEVDVNHNAGKITTLGEDSIGIFAQSAGGTNTGGTVDIGVSDDVICSGADSYGIVGQSIGKAGNGNVWVTIASGATVQSGDGGAGVKFMDGASNHLKNSGTLASSDGIFGMAVESVVTGGGAKTPGNETIENYGLITGMVDLGGGTNSFHNYSDGTFVSGPNINLGANNLFTNEGVINPGGTEGIHSVLTGNFTQTDTGIFQPTLFSNGYNGQLQVMGTASLNGALALTYGSDPFTAAKTYNVLTANAVQGQFSDEINPAPLLNVTTSYQAKGVQVTVTPQSFTTVAQNTHEIELGAYHDNVLTLADPDFRRALGKFQTSNASGFKSAFASFSPAVYDANTYTTYNVSRQYVRTIQERIHKVRQISFSQDSSIQASDEKPLSVAANDSDTSTALGSRGVSYQKQLRVSLGGFGQYGDADASGGLNGFDYDMGGFAVGGDYEVNDNLVIGAGFGFADSNIDLDCGFGSSDIDSFMSSVYGTYFIDRAYLEGVFTYGDHSYDNSRKISISDLQGIASSSHDADAFTGLLEGGYTFSLNSLAIQPYASLFYAYLNEAGFQEFGTESLNMHIGSSKTNDWASELGLRLSQDFKTSPGTLTPEFKAAWQYDFDVDRHTMPMSYAGSPLRLSIEGREQPGSALVGAGLRFTSICGVSASVEYDGEFAEDFSASGVFGQIQVPF